MKRIIALILTLVLVLGLCACGAAPNTTEPVETTTEPTDPHDTFDVGFELTLPAGFVEQESLLNDFFGTGDNGQAFTIAAGIALQNIPEGMVIIAPMLAAGISPRRTFLCAAATGVIEVVGTLLGYFAVSLSTAILPFALAFAGGTMLYVISDEMIPETHHNDASGVTYSLLAGFCLMLAMNYFL